MQPCVFTAKMFPNRGLLYKVSTGFSGSLGVYNVSVMAT